MVRAVLHYCSCLNVILPPTTYVGIPVALEDVPCIRMDPCIADGWANTQRNGSEPIQANITRFPKGIKAVADYVHAKGASFHVKEELCITRKI